MEHGKRVFLIVLDSFGIGEAPDAALWHDGGSDTLGTIRGDRGFDCPNLIKLGLFNIDGVGGGIDAPLAAYARLTEASAGKDTTIGHWEIAGIVSHSPLPTYPDGFPTDVIAAFEKATGRRTICNKPYSGTEVIKDYGEEHMRTGALIVYTSADSVFQIAAHEDVVPVAELYSYCETARKLLAGKHGVGRVIARPFTGRYPFTRTPRRHDYSLLPPSATMLDILSENGIPTVSVGKIYDIFAGKGVSEAHRTSGNAEGMDITAKLADGMAGGLCFVNLVDFDMLYGHRNDTAGYAAAMSAFDRWLGDFLPRLGKDDYLVITADHGCDPGTPSTDHSREYVPFLLYGKKIRPVNLGTRKSFADIAQTVIEIFGLDGAAVSGESMLAGCMDTATYLMNAAAKAREAAYTPYSHFGVGAALLADSGRIYTGCNIENASYTPTVCAERVAFFKAVSAGEHSFKAIAVTGGKGDAAPVCAPCGVCRQVMAEFCTADFDIFLGTPENIRRHTLGELLPMAFTPDDLTGDVHK